MTDVQEYGTPDVDKILAEINKEELKIMARVREDDFKTQWLPLFQGNITMAERNAALDAWISKAGRGKVMITDNRGMVVDWVPPLYDTTVFNVSMDSDPRVIAAKADGARSGPATSAELAMFAYNISQQRGVTAEVVKDVVSMAAADVDVVAIKESDYAAQWLHLYEKYGSATNTPKSNRVNGASEELLYDL